MTIIRISADDLGALCSENERLRAQVGELQAKSTDQLLAARETRASRLSSCVREFLVVMQQYPFGSEHDHLAPHVPPEDVMRLRVALVVEEFLELVSSVTGPHECPDIKASVAYLMASLKITTVDLPAFADACIDLLYVVEGALLACGIDSEPLLAAVHAANLAKLAGGFDANGKKMKPQGWQPPDVEGALEAQGWRP